MADIYRLFADACLSGKIKEAQEIYDKYEIDDYFRSNIISALCEIGYTDVFKWLSTFYPDEKHIFKGCYILPNLGNDFDFGYRCGASYIRVKNNKTVEYGIIDNSKKNISIIMSEPLVMTDNNNSKKNALTMQYIGESKLRFI